MKDKNISTQDLKTSLSTEAKSVFLQLQCDIIDEQDRIESKMIDKPFISDRGPDPFIYIQTHCSKKALDDFTKRPSFVSCMNRYRQGSLCIILCPLDVSTDDGVRLVPTRHEQEEFNERLARLFTQYKIPFVQMNVTDLRRRVAMLEEAVNGKLPLPDLPGQLSIPFTIHPGLLNKCLYLRQVKITNENVCTSYDTFAPGHTNRMLDRYGQDLLVLCFDYKVSPKIVSDILRPGILINGEDYNFLGCSSSGLKSRTCYMFRGTKQRIGKVRKECGDFTRIPTVSKRLKRIGMLFSEVKLTNFAVHDDLVLIIDDIESPAGEVFTDGCGQIGIELAKRVMECMYTFNSVFTQGDYLPSVYQIRYQGCKGVVAIKDGRDTSKRQLLVRKSMKKFDSGSKPFLQIGLCDHSRPYSYGHLNKQFIILLSGLGITDEVFLKKQKEHFECLERMLEDPEIAIMVCCWKNRPELAARIARHSFGTAFANDRIIKNELSSLRSRLLTKIETNPSQHLKIKLRILITESRNIFGVCDPVGILEYGQCFVRPTIRGKPRTITGKVTVGKNPCYLLGDIRVLEAIDDPRLHHLVDCIVFPVKGNRPHPSEIAGSDLDGDQYFVTWDADLVPPTLVRPYDYPSVESSNIGNVDDYSMIDYFSRQNQTSGMMGRLDGYYMYWASKEGVKSDKCQQLGKLFSRSVDATKTGDSVRIPQYLIPGKDEFTQWQNEMGKRNDSRNVWERLECLALEESDKLKQIMVHELLDSEEEGAGLSEEFVWDLLEHRAVGISDFDIFSIARQWCLAQGFTDDKASKKLLEFSERVNFAVFTTDEKLCAIDWGIPVNIVTNALSKSKLLTHLMTQHFSFTDSHSYWNQYITTSSCDFQWKHLVRGLLTHHESIIVFQLPDEMVFAIHFLVQLNHGKQEMLPGSVVTYFFSPCFNLYLRRVLSDGYSVSINEELMQVYQGNERNTFMWIKSEALSRGQVEYDRVSIDLTRFKRDILQANGHPRVNKLCYSHVECYVKCFDDEKEYFDLYTTDQQDDLSPVVTEEHEMASIDEFPCCDQIQQCIDHHDTVEKLNTDYSMEGAITCLKACALDGDCNSFLRIVQMMLSHGKPTTIDGNVISHFISLLTVLATKYPPFPLSQELKETLQVVLTSIHMLISKPTDCLCVMDRLCHLQCQELVTESIMSCIEPNSFQDFIACLKEWSLWTLLPLDVATGFADRVTALYTPVQSRIESMDVQGFQELVRIAENPSEHFLCERPIKEAYVAKFLHLLVQQLISEVNSTKNNKQTIVSRLKAYRHGDGGQKPSNKNLIIGFRSTDTVASKLFKQGGYVSISLMSHATRKGVITGIGQIVQFTLHPTDIVIEVIEPASTCIERSADLDKGHWCLQLLGNITSFKRANNALVKVLETKGNELVPILTHPIGHSDYTPDTVTETCQDGTCSDSIPSEFNISQQRAIAASLNQRLTLIHGPPGTGKTRVACEIVRQVCERNEKTDKSGIVLVCAETNMAVDNLARKLLQLGIRVVRIGGIEGQVASDIRPIVLEQQIELKRIELGKAKCNTKYLDAGLAKKILRSAQVIAVTCTGAGDAILNDFTFDFVVIDEATQATEPVSLIPISHNCRQLVLIGDPQQLAPTLPSSNTTCDSLKTTLFHRLQRLVPSFFLELQYRMHPVLMEFPSSCFYKGKLKSAVQGIDRMLPPIVSVPSLQTNPLLFIDSHFKEHRIGTSFANRKEADTIKYLVTLLLNSNIPSADIAILTPYIGQVHTIRQCLPKHFDVSTIDSFQGRERDVIIFSAVRCNDRKEIGFLDDQYRVNVLLTRAKSCLIGVGSRDTLASSILWTEWFKQVEIIAGDDLNCDERKKVQAHRPKNQPYKRSPQKKH